MLRLCLLLYGLQLAGATIRLAPYLQVHVLQYPEAPRAEIGADMFRSTDGATWRKGVRGASRDGRVFASKRYLPCDEVRRFSEPSKGRVRLHTDCGDSEIWFEAMTLEQKARIYQTVADRHDRHGFIGDSKQGTTTSNDNDGLWTAMYASAQLFEYKATGKPEALARAEKAIRAVLFLEKVTGTPGYPARSYVVPGEEKPKDGFWYWTEDHKYQWKSDTSSDEIVGHFLMFSVAWDLLPRGALRDEVQATCRRMMDYILKNDYNLIDPKTGNPTRWGRWTVAYFAGEGRSDSPLNAIELVSFLRTTEHVTGDVRYRRELGKVVDELGYLKIAGDLKARRDELNYSDEELALLSFYPLLIYDKNPAILKALDAWFENIRREKNPLWNTIYEVGRGGNPALRKESITTMQRLPLDLISWKVDNSWRKELSVAPDLDRFGRKQTTTWLPPDERSVMKWNGNPFVLDGGNDGQRKDDGTILLLPYWMGRYHKFWEER